MYIDHSDLCFVSQISKEQDFENKTTTAKNSNPLNYRNFGKQN